MLTAQTVTIQGGNNMIKIWFVIFAILKEAGIDYKFIFVNNYTIVSKIRSLIVFCSSIAPPPWTKTNNFFTDEFKL